jgi:hypothetical protein
LFWQSQLTGAIYREQTSLPSGLLLYWRVITRGGSINSTRETITWGCHHEGVYTKLYKQKRAHIRTYMNTHIYTHSQHTQAHKHTGTHRHTYRHTHTHSLSHTHAHTQAHTDTDAHTHTQRPHTKRTHKAHTLTHKAHTHSTRTWGGGGLGYGLRQTNTTHLGSGCLDSLCWGHRSWRGSRWFLGVRCFRVPEKWGWWC